jgi:hypothetical protein
MKISKRIQIKTLIVEYIDEHRFLQPYLKDLIKTEAIDGFNLIFKRIGLIELASRRTTQYESDKNNSKIHK